MCGKVMAQCLPGGVISDDRNIELLAMPEVVCEVFLAVNLNPPITSITIFVISFYNYLLPHPQYRALGALYLCRNFKYPREGLDIWGGGFIWVNNARNFLGRILWKPKCFDASRRHYKTIYEILN